MNPDSKYALFVLGFLLVTIILRRFSFGLLEALLFLTRPGATIVLLSAVVYLYSRGFFYTAMAFALLAVVLLKDLWKSYPDSDARRLYLEIGRDQARFDARTSIDLQFANGTASHDQPSMLANDSDVSRLLVFPPSAEVLQEMNGL